MPDLRSALVSYGLARQEEADKASQRAVTKIGQNLGSLSRQPIAPSTMYIPDGLTARQFREVAKRIISTDPDLIREVANKAHGLPEKTDGRRKLIADLLWLRETLGKIKPDFREKVISRIMRGSNTTRDIKPEWRL